MFHYYDEVTVVLKYLFFFILSLLVQVFIVSIQYIVFNVYFIKNVLGSTRCWAKGVMRALVNGGVKRFVAWSPVTDESKEEISLKILLGYLFREPFLKSTPKSKLFLKVFDIV